MNELISVKKFAVESPELYKLFRDYADQYLAVEKGYKGKTFSQNLSMDEKEKAINKAFAEEIAKKSGVKAEAYDGDMMHYSANPMVKSFADAIEDKMIDMIIPEVINTSIGLIADISYIDWGDTASFDLENGSLFEVCQAGFDQKGTVAQELTDQTVTVVPTAHQITTRASLFDILTGRKSLAKYAMKAALSMQAKIANDAWAAFATAASQAVIPTQLYVDTYTDNSAIHLAETVTAWNAGKKAVFAGTPVALNQLLPTNANYRYTLDDAMVRLGYIPQFKNYDVMVTPQFANYSSSTYGLTLDDTKIYVVSPASDKLIKVAIGGSMTIPAETYGNADLTQEQTIMKSYGVVAASNAIAGAINI